MTDYERGFRAGVEAAAKVAAGRRCAWDERDADLGDDIADEIRALSPAPTAPQGEKESDHE
jgi:hypothetical protein